MNFFNVQNLNYQLPTAPFKSSVADHQHTNNALIQSTPEVSAPSPKLSVFSWTLALASLHLDVIAFYVLSASPSAFAFVKVAFPLFEFIFNYLIHVRKR